MPIVKRPLLPILAVFSTIPAHAGTVNESFIDGAPAAIMAFAAEIEPPPLPPVSARWISIPTQGQLAAEIAQAAARQASEQTQSTEFSTVGGKTDRSKPAAVERRGEAGAVTADDILKAARRNLGGAPDHSKERPPERPARGDRGEPVRTPVSIQRQEVAPDERGQPPTVLLPLSRPVAADQTASNAVRTARSPRESSSDQAIAQVRQLWGSGVDLTNCLVAPLAADQVRALVERHAQALGADVALAKAVAAAESLNGQIMISPAGALGIMQLMPGTAARYGVSNPCDPAENIHAGVRYLNDLMVQFGNPMLVVSAYNAGEGAVYTNNGIPDYPETAKYVVRILNEYYGLSKIVARSGKMDPPPLPLNAQSVASAETRIAAPQQGTQKYHFDATKWTGGEILYVR